MVKEINLSEKLGQDYYPINSEVILNFRYCFLVCTDVFDNLSKISFGIFYLVSDFLLAREIGRSYGNSNFLWSSNLSEIKKLYNLSDEDIGEIEFEMKIYQNKKTNKTNIKN